MNADIIVAETWTLEAGVHGAARSGSGCARCSGRARHARPFDRTFGSARSRTSPRGSASCAGGGPLYGARRIRAFLTESAGARTARRARSFRPGWPLIGQSRGAAPAGPVADYRRFGSRLRSSSRRRGALAIGTRDRFGGARRFCRQARPFVIALRWHLPASIRSFALRTLFRRGLFGACPLRRASRSGAARSAGRRGFGQEILRYGLPCRQQEN